MSIILDGKKLAEKITENIKNEIKENNYKPSLAVVIVGDNPASLIYVRNKKLKAEELGISSRIISLPSDISQEKLENEVGKLSVDDTIHAILVQLPLPKGLNAQKITEKITPDKDVDGFHPYNIGRLFTDGKPFALPCTPFGIVKILEEYNINVEGKNVVIAGRSNIVGKPLAAMLTNMNATVTLCHSKTKNLKDITSKADIFVSATGKTNFFDETYIKENAVVIDVGINRKPDGKITGDVDFESVKEKASYITPVPKGVGPVTIAMLMYNTLDLYKKKFLI